MRAEENGGGKRDRRREKKRVRGGQETQNKEWNINRFASDYKHGSTCRNLLSPDLSDVARPQRR